MGCLQDPAVPVLGSKPQSMDNGHEEKATDGCKIAKFASSENLQAAFKDCWVP